MFKIFYFMTLILTITIKLTKQQQQLVSNVCQSGIREDNTNYIYCARRSLNEIPIFSKNNVVYDELVLTDNRIKKLDANSFTRIKVKKIYLNGNPISFIDEKAFSKLENHLEELWLDSESSSDIISSSSSINADQQHGVPKSIVNYLRNLNTLRLKGMNINILENSVFKKLKKLEILSLQFCSIKSIELNAFEGLSNSMKELYLDGNLLQEIPTESLLNAAFTSLKILGLSQNNIKIINSNNFGYNYLNNNFDYFTNQISTNIGSLSSSSQSSSSSSFNNLIKLDLSYNGLKKIDSQAFNNFNKTLETLMLQNNEINSYNLKFLLQLTSLKDLNLGFNLITNLHSNLFKNSINLQYLSMQGNSILFDLPSSSSLPSQEQQSLELEIDEDENMNKSPFNGLVTLQRLNLARNGIKYLPNNLFKPMIQLKSLILDKNIIENFNEFTFNGLFKSLMNISLQNTKINSNNLICLKHFEKIERIKLGFNDIKLINWSLFEKMSKTLSNLDLQNNQIETIFYEINSKNNLIMDNLQELDFSNNKLCSINTNLINKSPKLKNLGLSQNPLYCDCNLLSLYEWTRRKFDKDMMSFIQWQCEIPTNNEVESLALFNNDDSINEFKYLNSNKYKKFTSLSIEDFICNNTRPSKCAQLNNANFNDINNAASTKEAFTNSIRNLFYSSSSSLLSSNSKKDLDSDFASSSLNKKLTARISNIQLKSTLNTVNVEWELDQIDFIYLNDIQGFKINFNKLKLDETNSNLNGLDLSSLSKLNKSISSITGSSSSELFSSNAITKSSFLVDKSKRNFQIENLDFNSRYTICVSILRYQGYDKYCRDIEIGAARKDSSKSLKMSSTKKLINLSVDNNLKDNYDETILLQAANKTSNSKDIISSLMITILVILICFIFGLIAFIFVYVKKCKKNQRKKSTMKTKSLMSTINSRRDYTGATLTDSSASSSIQTDNFEKTFNSNNQILNNNCCNNCDTLIKLNNHHQHNGLITINPRNQIHQQPQQMALMTGINQKYYQISNFNPTSIELGGKTSNFVQALNIGDTSTVSSTLSSLKPIDKLNDNIEISTNQQHHHQMISTTTTSDISSSSPSSFTHFVIPQQNTNNQQHQQIPMSYIPYELYNCIQTNGNGTLILPSSTIQNYHSQNQQILPSFLTSTNSKKIISNYEVNNKSKMISNQSNLINMNTINSDHVYCEIPSTMTMSRGPGGIINGIHPQHQTSNNNNNNNNNNLINYKNSHNNQHHLISDSNQQNSSTSLLLSSSSSSSSSNSSSNSTSPQSNSILAQQLNTMSTKYMPASII
jgi:hypothetical protein